MNQNTFGQDNNSNVSPYKAAGNLNTTISNPNANINDTMNVNIQSMPTKTPHQPLPQLENIPTEVQQNVVTNNVPVSENNNELVQNKSAEQVTNQSENATKTYVTNENQKKKKTVTLNMGPEFKLALLIVIILLVFVLLLPLVPNLF